MSRITHCRLIAEALHPFRCSRSRRSTRQALPEGRRRQLDQLVNAMEVSPLVAPFDAELFGHWRFEGPAFPAELFRQGPAEGVH